MTQIRELLPEGALIKMCSEIKKDKASNTSIKLQGICFEKAL